MCPFRRPRPHREVPRRTGTRRMDLDRGLRPGVLPASSGRVSWNTSGPVTACPSCAQSVRPGSTACDWCAVRLGYDARGTPYPVLPPIRPGQVVAIHDFSHVPLPGTSARDKHWDDGDSMVGTPQGVVLTLLSGLRWFNQPFLRMRDVCVRAAVDALDADLRIRVVARKQAVGSASVWYELGVTATDRQYRLSRLFTSNDHTDSTSLRGPLAHDAVAPVGGTNVLELRVQGPTLETWVNGVQLCCAHDAALGIGGVAIGVGVLETGKRPRRALCRWLEIREVAP